MQKTKQFLFASLFFFPPLLFIVATFLPLLGHRPPHLVFLGLVPLSLVIAWQAYKRGKIFPR